MASLSEVYGAEVKAVDITSNFKVQALSAEDFNPSESDEFTLYLVNYGTGAGQTPTTDLYYGGRKLTDLVVLKGLPDSTYPENKIYLVINENNLVYNLYTVHQGEVVPLCPFADGFIEDISFSDDGLVDVVWKLPGEAEVVTSRILTTDYDLGSYRVSYHSDSGMILPQGVCAAEDMGSNVVTPVVSEKTEGMMILQTFTTDVLQYTGHRVIQLSLTSEGGAPVIAQFRDNGEPTLDAGTYLLRYDAASDHMVVVGLCRDTIEYVTPEMFGAVGNAVTDDTNALRTAIEQAHLLKKVLYIPEKRYLCGALELNKKDGLEITGSGTLVHDNTDTSNNWITFKNSPHIRISGIRLDGQYAPVRVMKLYKSDHYHICNVRIYNVGNDDTSVDTAGVWIPHSSHGVIEDIDIEYVHSAVMASGIHLSIDSTNERETEALDYSTLSQHTRVVRPVIRDIAPMADADGIKIIGGLADPKLAEGEAVDGVVVDADLIVSDGYFEDCRKRALKFQAQGCVSKNNVMKFNEQTMFPIDFQRGYGRSINDRVILNHAKEDERNTTIGLAFSVVSVAVGEVEIDGLVVDAPADMDWLAGKTTSSCFLRPNELSGFYVGTIKPIKVRNCNVSGVGHFVYFDRDHVVTVERLDVVDTTWGVFGVASPNLFVLADGTLTYLYMRNLKTDTALNTTGFFNFLNPGTGTLGGGDMDLTGVDSSQAVFTGRGDGFNVRSRGVRAASNYDMINGRKIYYANTNANPTELTATQGAGLGSSKAGDLWYRLTPSVANGYINIGWICTQDAGYTDSAGVTYDRGVWETIRYTGALAAT